MKWPVGPASGSDGLPYMIPVAIIVVDYTLAIIGGHSSSCKEYDAVACGDCGVWAENYPCAYCVSIFGNTETVVPPSEVAGGEA